MKTEGIILSTGENSFAQKIKYVDDGSTEMSEQLDEAYGSSSSTWQLLSLGEAAALFQSLGAAIAAKAHEIPCYNCNDRPLPYSKDKCEVCEE